MYQKLFLCFMSEVSREFIDYLLVANRSLVLQVRRQHWRNRLHTQGRYAMVPCIDARLSPADTLDPDHGPVLSSIPGFAGATPPHRLEGILNDKKTQGCIFVSHWDGDQPDHDMGYGGCGARSASKMIEEGGEVPITGSIYIRNHVSPHYIDTAMGQALVASNTTIKPCVAMGIDHVTQEPFLFGIAENGQWLHTIPDPYTTAPIPHLDHQEVQRTHPHIASFIRQGQEFSAIQKEEDRDSRRVQNPNMIWVSGSLYPTQIVFGSVPIGQIMRCGVVRHAANNGHALSGGEDHTIIAHASYPFHQASSGGSSFSNTNVLLIDGKNPLVVENIWKDIQRHSETQQWLDSGPRLVMGAVMHGGQIGLTRCFYPSL